MNSVRVLRFAELSPLEAYAVWRLRQDVFVVEQECPYPDLDGRDPEPGTRHLLLDSAAGELLGYLRILDLGAPGAPARIGRVVLTSRARGRGLAEPMMRAALTAAPEGDLVLDAQTPLAGWYGTFGFVADGPEFLEDGIAHLPMRLTRG